VGLLLAKLDTLGLTTNTIGIFTSDNGGFHVPEGPHSRITDSSPFRAGKGFLYEGGLRAPLIVSWPGRVPARVVDAPVINTDWFPTLMELIGPPAPQNVDGRSFAALLTGASAEERTLFWPFPHYTNQGGRLGGAGLQGRWKIIEHYDIAPAELYPELYHLAAHPGEATNVAASEPERTASLCQLLARWIAGVDARTGQRPASRFSTAVVQTNIRRHRCFSLPAHESKCCDARANTRGALRKKSLPSAFGVLQLQIAAGIFPCR
jgi:arylsulfatase A-like enzyme